MAEGFEAATLPITTERMVLRRFTAGDGDALLALYGLPDVSRYLYSEPMTAAGLGEALERRLRPPRLAGEGDLLELAAELRSTGELVGAMTFFYRSTEHRGGEIGFVVHPHHQGQGLAGEGAAAMLDLGFDVLDLHRIEGQCDHRNTASAAVMTRLGMRQEAHLRENEWVKGEWTDALVFAMLAEEWRRRP